MSTPSGSGPGGGGGGGGRVHRAIAISTIAEALQNQSLEAFDETLLMRRARTLEQLIYERVSTFSSVEYGRRINQVVELIQSGKDGGIHVVEKERNLLLIKRLFDAKSLGLETTATSTSATANVKREQTLMSWEAQRTPEQLVSASPSQVQVQPGVGMSTERQQATSPQMQTATANIVFREQSAIPKSTSSDNAQGSSNNTVTLGNSKQIAAFWDKWLLNCIRTLTAEKKSTDVPSIVETVQKTFKTELYQRLPANFSARSPVVLFHLERGVKEGLLVKKKMDGHIVYKALEAGAAVTSAALVSQGVSVIAPSPTAPTSSSAITEANETTTSTSTQNIQTFSTAGTSTNPTGTGRINPAILRSSQRSASAASISASNILPLQSGEAFGSAAAQGRRLVAVPLPSTGRGMVISPPAPRPMQLLLRPRAVELIPSSVIRSKIVERVESQQARMAIPVRSISVVDAATVARFNQRQHQAPLINSNVVQAHMVTRAPTVAHFRQRQQQTPSINSPRLVFNTRPTGNVSGVPAIHSPRGTPASIPHTPTLVNTPRPVTTGPQNAMLYVLNPTSSMASEAVNTTNPANPPVTSLQPASAVPAANTIATVAAAAIASASTISPFVREVSSVIVSPVQRSSNESTTTQVRSSQSDPSGNSTIGYHSPTLTLMTPRNLPTPEKSLPPLAPLVSDVMQQVKDIQERLQEVNVSSTVQSSPSPKQTQPIGNTPVASSSERLGPSGNASTSKDLESLPDSSTPEVGSQGKNQQDNSRKARNVNQGAGDQEDEDMDSESSSRSPQDVKVLRVEVSSPLNIDDGSEEMAVEGESLENPDNINYERMKTELRIRAVHSKQRSVTGECGGVQGDDDEYQVVPYLYEQQGGGGSEHESDEEQESPSSLFFDYTAVTLDSAMVHLFRADPDRARKDVTFLVGPDQQPVHAHKSFLAMFSPVFDDYFFIHPIGPLRAKETRVVPETDPVAFRAVIQFLYCKTWDPEAFQDAKRKIAVLEIAKRYQLWSINIEVRCRIRTELNDMEACYILDKTFDMDETNLREHALQHIYKNAMKIFPLDGELSIMKIRRDALCAILQSDELRAEEELVFQTAIRWAESRIRERWEQPDPNRRILGTEIREELGPALGLIRFPLFGYDKISDFSLQTTLEYNGLFTDTEELGIVKYLLWLQKQCGPAPDTTPFSTQPRVINRLIEAGSSIGRRSSDAKENNDAIPDKQERERIVLHIPRSAFVPVESDGDGEPSTKRARVVSAGGSSSKATDTSSSYVAMDIDNEQNAQDGDSRSNSTIMSGDQRDSTSVNEADSFGNMPGPSSRIATTVSSKKITVAPLLSPEEVQHILMNEFNDAFTNRGLYNLIHQSIANGTFNTSIVHEDTPLIIASKSIFAVEQQTIEEFRVKYFTPSLVKTVLQFRNYLNSLNVLNSVLLVVKQTGLPSALWDSGVNFRITINGIKVLDIDHGQRTLHVSRINHESIADQLLQGLKFGEEESLHLLENIRLEDVYIESLNRIPTTALKSVVLRKVRGIKDRVQFIKGCNLLEEFSCEDMGQETLDFGLDLKFLSEEESPTIRCLALGRAKLQCSNPGQVLTQSKLEELYIDNCTWTGEFVEAIPFIFPNLKKIKMCRNVTFLIVQKLLELPSLESLCVWELEVPKSYKKKKGMYRNAEIEQIIQLLAHSGLDRNWLLKSTPRTFLIEKVTNPDNQREWKGTQFERSQQYFEFTKLDFQHFSWFHFYKDFDLFYTMNEKSR